MHYKIYFNDKPLFLCDNISDAVIEPYLHHDDAVYIDEFSPHAIKSMIHEMEQPRIHAGIFYHTDVVALKKSFWKKFTIQMAGGGLVFNKQHDMLLIFRRNKWDLPKGKLEKNETIEQCAVREVEEETGLTEVELKKFLLTTYHTYHESGKHILKENHWYEMEVKGIPPLVPQLAEDITRASWVKKEALPDIMNNTYPSIAEILFHIIN
jgi:8-oxo-dGTP pyrophosphatase MutT (NUDIX family)